MRSPEDKHKLIVDEEAAMVVRNIFNWKQEGWNAQQIANHLNGLHIPSPMEYKKKCGHTGKEDPEKLHMGPPKSFSGNRVIPMLNDVRAALQQLRKQQLVTGVYSITAVDRYQNFVFRNKRGGLLRPTNVYYAMEEIVKFYNKKETAASREENRDPILLPSISPHILRHTFCTRMCENENNLKVIQEIMGHKNISITMEVYADATLKQKKDSFSNLDGKMKIS